LRDDVVVRFDYQTGTSFATAHVTGIVALLKQRNPQLTPDEVRQILTGTAHALTKKGATEENEDYGAGLADAFASLKRVPIK
jgi:subtilisin family serine protease